MTIIQKMMMTAVVSLATVGAQAQDANMRNGEKLLRKAVSQGRTLGKVTSEQMRENQQLRTVTENLFQKALVPIVEDMLNRYGTRVPTKKAEPAGGLFSTKYVDGNDTMFFSGQVELAKVRTAYDPMTGDYSIAFPVLVVEENYTVIKRSFFYCDESYRHTWIEVEKMAIRKGNLLRGEASEDFKEVSRSDEKSGTGKGIPGCAHGRF